MLVNVHKRRAVWSLQANSCLIQPRNLPCPSLALASVKYSPIRDDAFAVEVFPKDLEVAAGGDDHTAARGPPVPECERSGDERMTFVGH